MNKKTNNVRIKEIDDYFSTLSDEEFINISKEAGIEISDKKPGYDIFGRPEDDDKRLEDAIQHCKDIVNDNNTDCKCKKEHQDLLRWLEELKDWRLYNTIK